MHPVPSQSPQTAPVPAGSANPQYTPVPPQAVHTALTVFAMITQPEADPAPRVVFCPSDTGKVFDKPLPQYPQEAK